jgi:hypothetical protein
MGADGRFWRWRAVDELDRLLAGHGRRFLRSLRNGHSRLARHLSQWRAALLAIPGFALLL